MGALFVLIRAADPASNFTALGYPGVDIYPDLTLETDDANVGNAASPILAREMW